MKEVGALEEGEKLLYFYSDAIMDIRDSFCFVSNKRVVTYSRELGDSDLTAITFDEIKSVDIHRDESFLTDSTITIETDEDRFSFPVSSEQDRDQDFHDEIKRRSGLEQ